MGGVRFGAGDQNPRWNADKHPILGKRARANNRGDVSQALQQGGTASWLRALAELLEDGAMSEEEVLRDLATRAAVPAVCAGAAPAVQAEPAAAVGAAPRVERCNDVTCRRILRRDGRDLPGAFRSVFSTARGSAQGSVMVINVHPAYTALIFKLWQGVPLKTFEGRSQNMTRKSVDICVRCCFHGVQWCSRRGCKARTMDTHSNTVLDLREDEIRELCSRCRIAVQQYRSSWQEIVEIVQSHRPNMDRQQVLEHIRVPEQWLGKIVGRLTLAPGVSVAGLATAELRSRTLATAAFLTRFKVTHQIGSAEIFENPIASVNRAKPGLWVAEL
jgi:hypothetical protein